MGTKRLQLQRDVANSSELRRCMSIQHFSEKGSNHGPSHKASIKSINVLHLETEAGTSHSASESNPPKTVAENSETKQIWEGGSESRPVNRNKVALLCVSPPSTCMSPWQFIPIAKERQTARNSEDQRRTNG